MYQHTVQYYETDKMKVTHHSNYIRWMEEARIDFLNKLGWEYAKLEEAGVYSPVIGVSCKYKAPTTFADVVEIDVGVKEFNGVRLVISYIMKKQDGTLVLEGTTEHCFLSAEGRPVRLNRIVPAFSEALRGLAQE